MSGSRYLEGSVRADLRKKMVFVAGPRQVGKTTLARRILAYAPTHLYLNWDSQADRRVIRKAQWPPGDATVGFDEIHKWKGWKRWLKGEYDLHGERLHFLVTGSARLEVYRRGGDSLQGRYHHYRLHPFSAGEILRDRGEPPPLEPGADLPTASRPANEPVALLMARSGFPEPLFSGTERGVRRWQKERLDRFFREDVRDLEAVRELSSIQLLADLLPDRVGSPLSLNALREDLEVSHRGVSHWVDVLERLYHVVRIRPHTSPRVRSLRLMPKLYLWDWTLVGDRAARFENLMALHLLKLCHYLEDREGYATELRYLRDRAGHEVDFLVTLSGKPWLAVEAKLSETRIDRSLTYFKERLGLRRCYQVVLEGTRDFLTEGVRCLPAGRFLAGLP
jgi:predicted AAA+ superfamily ATPase